MTIATILSLGETALKLGLICSLTVLALFLSYSMLNVCDLSTDGCFTLGAAVGAAVAVSGHPFLSIFAAMAAGICSGFVTAILQTKLGVDSLLAGIIVNTALLFCEYCSDGRFLPDQYEQNRDGIFHDERNIEKYTAERKRRYCSCFHCSSHCDCLPCIFLKDKTWSGNQGNRK